MHLDYFRNMHFEFNFFSSVLLIFFFHGLVYAIMLFRKSRINDSNAEKWLGIFLLLCILYILPWMLGFAGWYDNQPYRDILFYVPTQHILLIGPVVFFYVQSLLNPGFRFGKKEALHLIPGILYILFTFAMFITDKWILKKYYFLANGVDPDFNSWYQYAGFFSMTGYFLWSLRYFNLYKKLMVQVISYADVVVFKWVKIFLVAFLIMLISRLIFYILGNFDFFQKYRYMGSWWEFFSFALVFYYIGITGYSNALETKVSFRLNLMANRTALLLGHNQSGLTSDEPEEADYIIIETDPASLPNQDEKMLEDWKTRILTFIQEDKAYEDPELSLTQVAKSLHTNPTIISWAINQGFSLNFNDFINKYRIEAVQQKLQNGEQKTQTLLGIAYDCGFNSKATFNRAFKKYTSLSPREWLQNNPKTSS